MAAAGFTRLLSAVVQGDRPDMQKFKATIDKQASAKWRLSAIARNIPTCAVQCRKQ